MKNLKKRVAKAEEDVRSSVGGDIKVGEFLRKATKLVRDLDEICKYLWG